MTQENTLLTTLQQRGHGRIFRDIGIRLHLFKGIWDTFENTEWKFRDIRIQRFLGVGHTCLKYYMILGILFQILSGIRDIGDPLPGHQQSIRRLSSQWNSAVEHT